VRDLIQSLDKENLTEDEKKVLRRKLKILSAKIHPDRTGSQPYNQRCVDLFKILGDYRDI